MFNLVDKCARYSQRGYPDECGDKRVQHLKFLLRDWNDNVGGFEDTWAKEVLRTTMSADHLQPISESVRSEMKKMSCFLLPHPGDGVKDPSYDGRLRNLNDDFVATLKSLIDGMLDVDELEIKQIDGVEATIDVLLKCTHRYIEHGTIRAADTVLSSNVTDLSSERQEITLVIIIDDHSKKIKVPAVEGQLNFNALVENIRKLSEATKLANDNSVLYQVRLASHLEFTIVWL